LEDDAKRQEFLDRIHALIALEKGSAEQAAEQPLSGRLVDALSEAAKESASAMGEVGRFLPNLRAFELWFGNIRSSPEGMKNLGRQALAVFLILGFAWLAEYLTGLLLSRARRRLEARDIQAVAARIAPAAARVALRLVALLAFIVAGYMAFVVFDPGDSIGKVALEFAAAYFFGRVLLVFARGVLAPKVPALRLLPLADESARYLYHWVRRMVTVALAGYALAATAVFFGLPRRGFDALMHALGLVLLVMALILILQSRANVSRAIRGAGKAGAGEGFWGLVRHSLAGAWPVLSSAYLVGAFVVWWQKIKGGFVYMARSSLLSAVIVFVAWLLIQGIRNTAARLSAAGEERQRRQPGVRDRAARYVPALFGILRWIVVVLAGFTILEVWGVDSFGWLATLYGRRLLSAAASITLVVAIALAVWEAVDHGIERYLAAADRPGRAPEHTARVRTLLPLMRKALLAVLIVIVAMIVLSEIGVNIGPLLAGAGIIGLAVGFGAQKLVQDVITGVFILLEDAVSVGDVVTVAGIGGLVEGMSIRSIRLRDLSGNMHTIPFSAVSTVTNMTKQYAYYVLDIGVAYREDTDEVAEVCRQILEAMRSEPEYAADILEPLEVLGVDQFADSAVILKARIKTRPIRQWAVGREFNRRMKKRFDELGIEIPFPHRTVYFGVDKQGTAPPVRVFHSPPADAGGTAAAARQEPKGE
jgi:small conductance mechanosensitive channel